MIIRVLQELLVTFLFSSVSLKLYQNKVSKQGKDKHPLNKREPLVARLAVDWEMSGQANCCGKSQMSEVTPETLWALPPPAWAWEAAKGAEAKSALVRRSWRDSEHAAAASTLFWAEGTWVLKSLICLKAEPLRKNSAVINPPLGAARRDWVLIPETGYAHITPKQTLSRRYPSSQLVS